VDSASRRQWQKRPIALPRDCGVSFPNFFPLLVLLIALAAAPSVLFAQEADHEQSKANDPTGAWLVTDVGDEQPSVLATFTRMELHRPSRRHDPRRLDWHSRVLGRRPKVD